MTALMDCTEGAKALTEGATALYRSDEGYMPMCVVEDE